MKRINWKKGTKSSTPIKLNAVYEQEWKRGTGIIRKTMWNAARYTISLLSEPSLLSVAGLRSSFCARAVWNLCIFSFHVGLMVFGPAALHSGRNGVWSAAAASQFFSIRRRLVAGFSRIRKKVREKIWIKFYGRKSNHGFHLLTAFAAQENVHRGGFLRLFNSKTKEKKI